MCAAVVRVTRITPRGSLKKLRNFSILWFTCEGTILARTKIRKKRNGLGLVERVVNVEVIKTYVLTTNLKEIETKKIINDSHRSRSSFAKKRAMTSD